MRETFHQLPFKLTMGYKGNEETIIDGVATVVIESQRVEVGDYLEWKIELSGHTNSFPIESVHSDLFKEIQDGQKEQQST